MNLPTIKTYRPDKKTEPHSFYILNKGLNSGKPMDQPCPNCFVAICGSQAERTTFYWLCYILWQSRSFYPYHRGSCVEFIVIHDVREILRDTFRRFTDPEVICKAAQQAQSWHNKTVLIRKQLELMQRAHRSFLLSVLRNTS